MTMGTDNFSASPGPTLGFVTGPAPDSILGLALGFIIGPILGSVTNPTPNSVTGLAFGSIAGPAPSVIAGRVPPMVINSIMGNYFYGNQVTTEDLTSSKRYMKGMI